MSQVELENHRFISSYHQKMLPHLNLHIPEVLILGGGHLSQIHVMVLWMSILMMLVLWLCTMLVRNHLPWAGWERCSATAMVGSFTEPHGPSSGMEYCFLWPTLCDLAWTGHAISSHSWQVQLLGPSLLNRLCRHQRQVCLHVLSRDLTFCPFTPWFTHLLTSQRVFWKMGPLLVPRLRQGPYWGQPSQPCLGPFVQDIQSLCSHISTPSLTSRHFWKQVRPH